MAAAHVIKTAQGNQLHKAVSSVTLDVGIPFAIADTLGLTVEVLDEVGGTPIDAEEIFLFTAAAESTPAEAVKALVALINVGLQAGVASYSANTPVSFSIDVKSIHGVSNHVIISTPVVAVA